MSQTENKQKAGALPYYTFSLAIVMQKVCPATIIKFCLIHDAGIYYKISKTKLFSF